MVWKLAGCLFVRSARAPGSFIWLLLGLSGFFFHLLGGIWLTTLHLQLSPQEVGIREKRAHACHLKARPSNGTHHFRSKSYVVSWPSNCKRVQEMSSLRAQPCASTPIRTEEGVKRYCGTNHSFCHTSSPFPFFDKHPNEKDPKQQSRKKGRK